MVPVSVAGFVACGFNFSLGQILAAKSQVQTVGLCANRGCMWVHGLQTVDYAQTVGCKPWIMRKLWVYQPKTHGL